MLSAAYADESYDLNLGVYILTASIVDLRDAEEIRDTLRALKRGGDKLHWSKEPHQRREEIAKTLGDLELLSVSVVARTPHLYAERARRKCMEALLPYVETVRADTVTLESRQHRNNRHDLDMVDACRRKRLISEGLHVTFALPGGEPLLWLPDIVCGAVLAAERADTRYLTQLKTAELITTSA